MSSSTRVAPQRQPAPPPLVPATPTGPAPAARRGVLARVFEGTPGRLRACALAGVVVCLIFAVLGADAFRSRSAALDAARDGAAQVVRVQGIATNLAQADAAVTNAFLQRGAASPKALQEFDGFVAAASGEIAEASRAEPQDATALAGVNQSLTRYSAAIATANANNRLGNEVGSAYLRQASQLLRTPSNGYAAILPTLQNVADADAARVDDAFGAARLAVLYLALSGLIVLAGLFAVQYWLARRTRRMFNVPVTTGTVLVLVALVAGALAMISSQSAADTVRDTHYAAAKALAQARIAGFDAKANESLTLVYRGTGQSYEATFQKQYAVAAKNVAAASDAGVADAGAGPLARWIEVHQAIKADDDKGQWDNAVKRATQPGDQNSPAVFAEFSDATSNALTSEAKAAAEGLQSSHGLLVALGWLTLALGVVAAGLSWRGIAQRLEEYR